MLARIGYRPAPTDLSFDFALRLWLAQASPGRARGPGKVQPRRLWQALCGTDFTSRIDRFNGLLIFRRVPDALERIEFGGEFNQYEMSIHDDQLGKLEHFRNTRRLIEGIERWLLLEEKAT